MNFIKQLERFQKLDKLIKMRCTGTPIELANKLGISRSHVYRLIDSLKDYGADICYCRKELSFYYKKPFKIEQVIPSNNLSDLKMENIKGGFTENIFPSFFMRRNSFTFITIIKKHIDITTI